MENEVATKTKAMRSEKPVKVKNVAKRAGSKSQASLEIFKRFSGVRADVIAAFQNELGMSKNGATTYFYNAKRIVG